jgi:hypothetical protein
MDRVEEGDKSSLQPLLEGQFGLVKPVLQELQGHSAGIDTQICLNLFQLKEWRAAVSKTRGRRELFHQRPGGELLEWSGSGSGRAVEHDSFVPRPVLAFLRRMSRVLSCPLCPRRLPFPSFLNAVVVEALILKTTMPTQRPISVEANQIRSCCEAAPRPPSLARYCIMTPQPLLPFLFSPF